MGGGQNIPVVEDTALMSNTAGPETVDDFPADVSVQHTQAPSEEPTSNDQAEEEPQTATSNPTTISEIAEKMVSDVTRVVGVVAKEAGTIMNEKVCPLVQKGRVVASEALTNAQQRVSEYTAQHHSASAATANVGEPSDGMNTEEPSTSNIINNSNDYGATQVIGTVAETVSSTVGKASTVITPIATEVGVKAAEAGRYAGDQAKVLGEQAVAHASVLVECASNSAVATRDFAQDNLRKANYALKEVCEADLSESVAKAGTVVKTSLNYALETAVQVGQTAIEIGQSLQDPR